MVALNLDKQQLNMQEDGDIMLKRYHKTKLKYFFRLVTFGEELLLHVVVQMIR